MISILPILTILGGIQGLFLVFFFLKQEKFKAKTFRYFALLLFSISITTLLVGLKTSPLAEEFPVINFLPLYCLLLGPFALYYCILYLVKPTYIFSKKEYWLLLPFALEVLLQLYILGLYFIDYPLLKAQNKSLNFYYDIIEGLTIAATFLTFLLSIRLLNKHQKQLLEMYSNLESRSLKWIRNMMLFCFVGLCFWLLAFITSDNEINSYYLVFFIEALLIYYLAYSLLISKSIFDIGKTAFPLKDQEQLPHELSSNTDTYYQDLLQLLEEQQLYKDPELSLTSLAEKMNLSSGYLSQIINKNEKRNFFDFINSYRVEEVKRNFNDPAFDHYSILGIALESGFKSKSTFNAVFKKMTGSTPSAFKKQISRK